MRQMSAKDLNEFLKTAKSPVLVDVREDEELEFGTLEGIKHIPMQSVPGQLNELEQYKNNTIVLICRSGRRSDQIGQFLAQMGFTDLINLVGGMNAWAMDVDSNITAY